MSKIPDASRPYWPDALSHPTHPTEGLLPWSWAEERLEKSHNYWIGTSRPGGNPHVMVVWGIWLEGMIWLSTGARTRKAKNLAANPHCVLCTEKADEAVIVEGIAEEVLDGPERRRFAKAYDKKYGGKIDAILESTGSIVLRVRPEVVFGFDEHAEDFAQGATRWKFDSE